MANVIGPRNWVLDTPSATVLWKDQIYIKFVEWYDPLALGDLMSLTDKNSVPIVKAIAEAAGDTQTFSLDNWFEGLIMPVLSSGVVYLHIK
jgi:hypothetical protein